MFEAYYHCAFHSEAIVCTAETLQFLIQAVGAEVVWTFAVVAQCPEENGRKYRCCVLGPGRSEMSQCSSQRLPEIPSVHVGREIVCILFCFVLYCIVHPFYCGQVNVSDLRAFKLDMLLRPLLYFGFLSFS